MPKLMIFAAQSAPTSSKAVARDGLSRLARSLYDTMPVVTMATSVYMMMISAMPAPMPSGTLRFGLMVSSDAVATTSNPRNAKNTRAAPERMPGTP